jgi:MarR family transcriptional regulator, organic hydroperoxide resistance regulator
VASIYCDLVVSGPMHLHRKPGSRLSLLFELYAASRASAELIHAAMAGAPLTPEEYAVYSVLFDEGPHAPTELARRTGMPPTSMSHFVKAMRERGHAERAPTPEDRRSYRIVLTDAGLHAHAASSVAFQEANDCFIRALTVDEEDARATLRAIGRAAAVGRERLIADASDATA